jgi:hypothetical protein
MLQRFKKLAFSPEYNPQDIQILQDNIEQYLEQISQKVLNLREYRVPRPSYYSDAPNNVVIVPGSSDLPSGFFIGDRQYRVTENVFMDMSRSGVGGIDTGSFEANTNYYLYAVLSGRMVNLISSKSPPPNGPQGISEWTYLGAFRTITAQINPFRASRGLVKCDNYFNGITHTGDTSWTEFNVADGFNPPVTTEHIIGFIEISGSNTNVPGYVSGTDNPSSPAQYKIKQTTITSQHDMVVSLQSYDSIWLKTGNSGNTIGFYSTGWLEDPTEYP